MDPPPSGVVFPHYYAAARDLGGDAALRVADLLAELRRGVGRSDPGCPSCCSAEGIIEAKQNKA